MSDTEKKIDERPKYKHKDGKCDHNCKFYENGYCKITGEYMLHTPMMGPRNDRDCEPYLIDLRRDAKTNHPEYHDTKDLDGEEAFDALKKFCDVMDDSGEVIEDINYVTLQDILDELRSDKKD
jgi:hypothetical protein